MIKIASSFVPVQLKKLHISVIISVIVNNLPCAPGPRISYGRVIKDRTSAEALVVSLDLIKQICPVKSSCQCTKSIRWEAHQTFTGPVKRTDRFVSSSRLGVWVFFSQHCLSTAFLIAVNHSFTP